MTTYRFKTLDEAVETLGRIRDCVVPDETAKAPAPLEEPTGLGAVVRSAGWVYVRTGGMRPWYCPDRGDRRKWSELEAPVILSHGYDIGGDK